MGTPVSGQFAGKTMTAKTPSGALSSHAGVVGTNFYGSTGSIAPGITQIDGYEANDWINGGWMNFGTLLTPDAETSQVQNHSWVGTTGNATQDAEILRRLDFAINRDGFTAVVGVNNGLGIGNSDGVQYALLSNAYNVISVGLTNGTHAHGLTTTDGAGRVVPDLVAPNSLTSFATPYVSASAALVIGVANTTPALANAKDPRAVKAILMAGATKSEFGAAWDRTTTRPIDEVYGAGELNIDRSYHILAAGENESSESALVNTIGWDLDQTVNGTRHYFFDVPAGGSLSELSVMLVWDRDIDLTLTPTLTDLNLRLYNASGFTLGSQIDSSVSTLYNLEHIYQPGVLGAGRYALEVSSPTAGVDYSLAWYSELTVIPEPASVVLLGAAVTLLASRRRA
jgi:hypothetical protein